MSTYVALKRVKQKYHWLSQTTRGRPGGEGNTVIIHGITCYIYVIYIHDFVIGTVVQLGFFIPTFFRYITVFRNV